MRGLCLLCHARPPPAASARPPAICCLTTIPARPPPCCADEPIHITGAPHANVSVVRHQRPAATKSSPADLPPGPAGVGGELHSAGPTPALRQTLPTNLLPSQMAELAELAELLQHTPVNTGTAAGKGGPGAQAHPAAPAKPTAAASRRAPQEAAAATIASAALGKAGGVSAEPKARRKKGRVVASRFMQAAASKPASARARPSATKPAGDGKRAASLRPGAASVTRHTQRPAATTARARAPPRAAAAAAAAGTGTGTGTTRHATGHAAAAAPPQTATKRPAKAMAAGASASRTLASSGTAKPTKNAGLRNGAVPGKQAGKTRGPQQTLEPPGRAPRAAKRGPPAPASSARPTQPARPPSSAGGGSADTCMLLEARLLQWTYLNVRAEEALREQEAKATRVLCGAFDSVQAAATKLHNEEGDLAAARYCQQLDGVLDTMDASLLPAGDLVAPLRQQHARLAGSVRATMHRLPVRGICAMASTGTGTAGDDPATLTAALDASTQILKSLAGSMRGNLGELDEYARAIGALKSTADDELAALQQCMLTLTRAAEYETHERSLRVHQHSRVCGARPRRPRAMDITV